MLSTLAFSFSSWVVTALSSWPRLSFWSVSSRTSSSSSSTRLLATIVVLRSSSKLFLVTSGEATAPWSPAGQEGELLPARVVLLGALQLLQVPARSGDSSLVSQGTPKSQPAPGHWLLFGHCSAGGYILLFPPGPHPAGSGGAGSYTGVKQAVRSEPDPGREVAAG